MVSHNQTVGRFGELLARDVLLLSGYSVVATNFRSRWGEIDIIAQKGPVMSFVEVKCRQSRAYGFVEESILPCKVRRTIRTAEVYLTKHTHEGDLEFLAVCIDDRTGQVEVRIHQQEIPDFGE